MNNSEKFIEVFNGMRPSELWVMKREKLWEWLSKPYEKRLSAKWIWKESRGVDYCYCSICHDGMWEMEFDYCPHCGARMRGAE